MHSSEALLASASRQIRRVGFGIGFVLPTLLWCGCLFSSPASADGGGAGSIEVEVHGDVLYSHYDFGPDQRADSTGAPADSRAILDVPTFVTEIVYAIRPDLHFEVEIEFEHGGTGSALELEYEEFGEYEVEIEKGGEVTLEKIHLTKNFNDFANLRAGRVVAAIGLINKSHHPEQFFTATRPEAEVNVIPTTWNEIGMSFFGQANRFQYRLQVLNGLDSTGFDSKYFVVGGAQKKFEQVRATDFAIVARVDSDVLPGVSVGGSLYTGNTTGNRPKKDMKGIDARLTIVDLHSIVDRGPMRARALYLNGDLDNADLISAKNARLSSRLQVARTPVASQATAWYVEFGYDLLSLIPEETSPFRKEARFYPFVHVSRYNTMASVPDGGFALPRFDRRVFSFGAQAIPTTGISLKAEWSQRSFSNDIINEENTFSLNLGFSTQIFERKTSHPNPKS